MHSVALRLVPLPTRDIHPSPVDIRPSPSPAPDSSLSQHADIPPLPRLADISPPTRTRRGPGIAGPGIPLGLGIAAAQVSPAPRPRSPTCLSPAARPGDQGARSRDARRPRGPARRPPSPETEAGVARHAPAACGGCSTRGLAWAGAGRAVWRGPAPGWATWEQRTAAGPRGHGSTASGEVTHGGGGRDRCLAVRS